MVVYSSNLW